MMTLLWLKKDEESDNKIEKDKARQKTDSETQQVETIDRTKLGQEDTRR